MYPRINSESIYSDEKQDQTLGRRIATYLSDYKWYNKSIVLEEVEKVTASSPQTATEKEEEGTSGIEVALEDVVSVEKPPSLNVAWEYFEHIILPRRLADGSSTTKVLNAKYQRAEPGDMDVKTKLYPVWDTPVDDMGDFGIGVGT